VRRGYRDSDCREECRHGIRHVFFHKSFRFRLNSRLERLIDSVNTLGKQVASHKLDGLKPSSFGFAEQNGRYCAGSCWVRSAWAFFRKAERREGVPERKKGRPIQTPLLLRILDSPWAATSLVAAVSAAKGCPATNPMIPDLRATSFTARLARSRSGMTLGFEAGSNFPTVAPNTTYRATRLAELLDSLAFLSPVQRRRAFVAGNPP